MSGFDDSKWANAEFSQGYRERADHYIPERHKMIDKYGIFTIFGGVK